MFPELRERRARAVEPERLEVLALADLGVLAVADRAIEELRETPRLPPLERLGARPALVAEASERPDDRRGICDVRGRALLHVEHPDLDRHPFEARDRAARIDPLVAQDAFGIMRCKIRIDPREEPLLILL